MKRTLGCVVIGLLLFGNASAYGQTIWWETGMQKLRQSNDSATDGDPPPGATDPRVCSGTCPTINLSAARNEFEPFQIFIGATDGNLSAIDVTISDFTKGSDTIFVNDPQSGRPTNILIYRENYVSIPPDHLSSTGPFSDAKPGLWPDALIPKVDEYFGEPRRMPGDSVGVNAFPFNVTSGNKQGIWIDIYVPSGQPAGIYTGHAKVFSGCNVNPCTTQLADFTVQLTVRAFELPS